MEILTVWLYDIRYGLRILWKNPLFTTAAVLTLALGIGANSAMFSVLNAVLLQALPFQEPERLVTIWEINPQQSAEPSLVSASNFADWQSESKVFERMALYDSDSLVLTGAGEPTRIPAAQVSADFFPLLGTQAIAGRTFLPHESQPGNERVVMLSHQLWQRTFNSDPQIVGKALVLNNNSYSVVGVLPPDFRFTEKADLWTPIPQNGAAETERAARHFLALARLRSDATIKQAQAALDTLAQRLQQQYPESNANWGVKIVELRDYLVVGVRSSLLTLFGAVCFLLLIACANVANLILARTTARQQEFAIRTALGSTRLSLVRQLTIESILLALLGGAVGIALAFWSLKAIAALIPETVRRGELRLDGWVLVFTLAISLLTGVIFGLIPSLKASRSNLNELLKGSGRAATGGLQHVRVRSLLVISEVGLAVVLLVGAGLMIKSFWRLQKVDPGFNPDQVLTARIFLSNSTYPGAQQRATFFQRLLQQLETVPGVESVGAVTSLPLSGSSMNFRFTVEGQPPPQPGTNNQAQYRAVSPNYFRALGMPLRQGRDLTERDAADAPGVVVINETLARRLFPNGDAIGKRLTINYMKPTPREIVGIVGDVKHLRLDEPAKPEMYVPYLQNPWAFMTIVVRTTVPPETVAPALRSQVWNLNKDQPIDKLMTMEQILYESVAQPRLYMLLLTGFAVLAIFLAAVGVYGVMSYVASQRTHEIGIRMALGAQQSDILRLVVRQGMVNVLIGIALGLVASFALTSVLTTLLYEVRATDPATYVLVLLLLAGVALLACYLPARRATKVDPITALRHE